MGSPRGRTARETASRAAAGYGASSHAPRASRPWGVARPRGGGGDPRRLWGATAVAVLTHDNKFDVPALKAALAQPIGYVGAIGSRGTREQRDARLRAEGVTDEQIGHIHGPIGLDIGARTPEEIALAIMAQIVAVRQGKSH